MASPLELLKSISEHGVEFVLVGGMAGIVHGSSVVTEDLSLAISFDVNTMEKVLAALDAFSPRLNAPGRPELPSPDARHYVGWRNLYLVTSAGPLALLGEITGVGRFEDEDTLPGQNDPDVDGISTALELLLGTAAGDSDTDDDTVPDTFEVFGNDGFSYSERGSPTRRTAFVEIDFMTHPTSPGLSRQPYTGLPADVFNIFKTDSPDGVDVHFVVSNTLPWHEHVTYQNCSAPANMFTADCVNFYDIKAANFAIGAPERAPYFHYAIWAWRLLRDGHTWCGGQAEYLGNDIIVAGECDFSQAFDRGVFMHEFGHNLGLGHNGNESTTGANSTIHHSVMNYRYDVPGIPGRTAPLHHTYSFGANGCDSCSTSAKEACVACRNSALGCWATGCSNCDCDVGEWSGINLNALQGTQWNDASLAAYANSRHIAPDEKTLPPVWTGPKASEPREHRIERIAARRIEFTNRGMIEERDFTVSADGEHIYSTCR